MTDKQIIIDGVPVQDCCYFDYENDGYEDSCYIHQNECSAQNCYYKQHKRDEQRIVELNKTIKAKEQECEELAYENYELNELFDRLKAENEELTTINARLLGRLEVDEIDTSLVFNLDKELRQKEKEFYTAIQKVVKLKQTLTEIKEIAETCQGHNVGGCYDCKYFDNCEVEDEEIPTRDVCKLILQKISEVENG